MDQKLWQSEALNVINYYLVFADYDLKREFDFNDRRVGDFYVDTAPVLYF